MSDTSLEVIRIAPSLVLRTPDGRSIQVTSVHARIVYNNDALRDVQLWFDVTPEQWRQVDAEQLFHLDPAHRGPCFAGGFHGDAPITIEARLGTTETTLMSLITDNIWEVGGVLLEAEMHPAVHDTEAWYALVVKQPRGGLKTGFMTTWGGWEPPAPREGPDAR